MARLSACEANIEKVRASIEDGREHVLWDGTVDEEILRSTYNEKIIAISLEGDTKRSKKPYHRQSERSVEDHTLLE